MEEGGGRGRGLGLCVYYPTPHLDFNKADVYMSLKVFHPGRPCHRECSSWAFRSAAQPLPGMQTDSSLHLEKTVVVKLKL